LKGDKVMSNDRKITIEVDLMKYNKQVIEYVSKYYEPQDVFKREDLEQWALDNGFKQANQEVKG
jgi:hypothetical protein